MRISKLKLALAMGKRRVNFKELSSLSGVSRATLSYINNGKSCRINVAAKIAAALGVDVTDLIESPHNPSL